LPAVHQTRTDNNNIQGVQKTELPQKSITQRKKWVSELNKAFPKEELQMAKKYMKKCSPFLTRKEIKNANQNTLRFHLTMLELLSPRTQTTLNVGKDAGIKESSYLLEEI
jgi:hypothetical protein